MSDELKEEKLDSPLIVHKKSDASYQDTASEAEMNETHSDDEGPTLERHRFKKKGKKKGKGLVIVIIIVILAAVFAGLYEIALCQKSNVTAVHLAEGMLRGNLQVL